ncbi:class II aldolase/adducin family protein [Georgenia faecalis]|uniref:class II aldolase/adducin family protein n=1 Tax=Georgenia faecalis TaxID=2483799 RepID=UPI000FDB1E8A|nr:class II aldolase/adducin family protein [Georgenia faecalis]
MSDPVQDVLDAGRALAAYGMSPGSSGNLSVRTGEEVWMSASGTSLATLEREQMARTTLDGRSAAGAGDAGAGDVAPGPRPTKEAPLHLAMYARDDAYRCVIHLHSPHAVAASCLPAWREHTAFAPLTPYVLMRVGNVPLVRYAPPGDPAQAEAVRQHPLRFHGVLLGNHGSVVAGRTVAEAVDRAIEVEEAARTQLLLAARTDARLLTETEIAALVEKYGMPWG